MALVKKSSVTLPVARRVIHPFPPLDGDVCVRGLGLAQRLEMRALLRELDAAPVSAPSGAPPAPEASTPPPPPASARHDIVPVLLSLSVLGEGDEQLGTPDEWDALGAQHPAEVIALFNIAFDLSGLDGEANRKNS